MIRTGKILSVIFNNDNYEDKVELNLGDYEVKEEDGKWFAVRKKNEYPKTYEECCEVLGHVTIDEVRGYKATLLDSLQMLLVCRDAYWKISGEEMGLEKPWEPDWKNIKIVKYCIMIDNSIILESNFRNTEFRLVFPTAEMRDAFYENFKDLIEQCKELL